MYSAWQRLNLARAHDREEFQRLLKDARIHLTFVCRLYKKQMDAGRLLLHEHPAYATSWGERAVRRVLSREDVESTIMDQCAYGQKSFRGLPVKKPTRWMSKSEPILKELSTRCAGKNGECSHSPGGHDACSGRVAKEAAIYPFKICEAILKGLRKHLEEQGITRSNKNKEIQGKPGITRNYLE